MEDKTSINYLKELLYLEVKDLIEKENKVNDLKDIRGNIIRIISVLSTNNYQEISDNLLYISLLIDKVLSTNEETENEPIKDTINKKLSDSIEALLKSQGTSNINAPQELGKVINMFAGLLTNIIVSIDSLYSSSDRNLMIRYKSIISKFKYSQIISDEDFDLISRFFDQKGIESKSQVLILEKIKNHNSYVATRINQNGSGRSMEERYAVINILTTGFEELSAETEIDIEMNQRLREKINTLTTMISFYETDKETILSFLPKSDDMIHSDEEVKSILIGVLEEYQNKIYSQIELISDKNFYMDNEIKQNIMNDYYRYVNVYNIVRNYYNALEEKLNEIIDTDDNTSSPEIEDNLVPESKVVRKLIYSRAGDTTDLEDDLIKDVPEEYYNGVLKLIREFEADTINYKKIKQLTNNANLKGFKELKSDQIRIVFKQLIGNYYNILGVGIKKSDTDELLYTRLASRPLFGSTNLEDLESEYKKCRELEAKLLKDIKEKARKSNR